ncbi:unnamed protein product [marine sediment metagenome]|uniref:Uncharacterized protein n=1 Tax=marine sediment metagenome TaxID=412755 RepID=X1LL41_9ZZZZ
MRAKSGPIYERWKTNRLKALQKEVDAEKPLPEYPETQQPREPELPDLPEYPEENGKHRIN